MTLSASINTARTEWQYQQTLCYPVSNRIKNGIRNGIVRVDIIANKSDIP